MLLIGGGVHSKFYIHEKKSNFKFDILFRFCKLQTLLKIDQKYQKHSISNVLLILLYITFIYSRGNLNSSDEFNIFQIDVSDSKLMFLTVK